MRNVVLLPGFALGAALAAAGVFVGAMAIGACSASDPGAFDCVGALPIPGMARAADCSGPLVVYASEAGSPTTTPTPTPDAATEDDTDQDAATGGDASATDATTTTTAPEFAGDTFDKGEQPSNQSSNSGHSFDGGTNPFKQVCQSCHAPGTGSAAAVSDVWSVAGSISKGANGPAASEAVEVRVIGADGGVYGGTYSDPNGNFWIQLAGNPPLPAGAHVAIRSATSTMIMADTLTSGSCNAAGGCHGTSPSPGPIYIP